MPAIPVMRKNAGCQYSTHLIPRVFELILAANGPEQMPASARPLLPDPHSPVDGSERKTRL
jgi:hypothetical protein